MAQYFAMLLQVDPDGVRTVRRVDGWVVVMASAGWLAFAAVSLFICLRRARNEQESKPCFLTSCGE